MKTYRQIIRDFENQLAEDDRNSNVVKVLLYHLLKIEPHELYLKIEEVMPQNIIDKLQEKIDLYLQGIPVQYINGYETFFGREFNVNNNVLIPRYETEELVEQILYRIDDYFEDKSVVDLVDVGTGCGAIAISLDLEEPKTNVYATDISDLALDTAKNNSNKLDAKVKFIQGDMLQPLIDHKLTFDFFVSNPPYIPKEQTIENVVKDHEPHVALFGGDDGLYFYREIFKRVKLLLKDKAILAFEIGYDQKESITEEVKIYFPGNDYEIIKDMNGKDRMLFIYHNIIKK
jgi:protein-(glutamine-N5) methyltransferase, release factor-specific